jgi:hypothetical protein
MSMRLLIFSCSAALICGQVLCGQVTQSSITATASRDLTVQPDEVAFSVRVDSPLAATLNTVIAAVASAGITQANFTGVSAYSTSFNINQLSWTFSLSAPLSQMKNVIDQLNALSTAVAKSNSGLTVSFYVNQTRVSQKLADMQTCPASDLLTDARSQAQKMADVAQLTLGNLLALSVPTKIAGTVPTCTITAKFAAAPY